MQYYPMQLSAVPVAGDTLFFDCAGTVVRYDEETSGAISPNNKITFKTDTGDQFVLKPGQAAVLARQFGRVVAANTNGVSNLAGTIAIGGGTGVQILDSNVQGTLTGAVTVTAITNQSSAFANTNKTVTNASAQLIAANAARRYLMIQNKDTAASIWFTWGAVAATTANGTLLGPNESYELDAIVSTQEIRAIGDAASNANVVVTEG